MYWKSLNAKCLNYKTFRRPFSLIGSVSRLAWPCCHELNLFVHILCAFLFQVLVSQGWRKVRKLGEGEQCDMHNLPTLVQCKMNYSAITKGGCPLLQAYPLASPLLPSVPLSLPYDDAQLHEIGTRAAVLLTWFIGCRKSDLVIIFILPS